MSLRVRGVGEWREPRRDGRPDAPAQVAPFLNVAIEGGEGVGPRRARSQDLAGSVNILSLSMLVIINSGKRVRLAKQSTPVGWMALQCQERVQAEACARPPKSSKPQLCIRVARTLLS